MLNNICCWAPGRASSLGPHGWQHTMLPCPSLFPGVCSNLCALNQWHIFKLFPPNLKLRPGKSNGAVRTVEGEEIRKCLGIQVPSPHFRVCSLGAFFRVAFRQVLTCMTGTGCRSHKELWESRTGYITRGILWQMKRRDSSFKTMNHFKIVAVEHEIKHDFP